MAALALIQARRHRQANNWAAGTSTSLSWWSKRGGWNPWQSSKRESPVEQETWRLLDSSVHSSYLGQCECWEATKHYLLTAGAGPRTWPGEATPPFTSSRPWLISKCWFSSKLLVSWVQTAQAILSRMAKCLKKITAQQFGRRCGALYSRENSD